MNYEALVVAFIGAAVSVVEPVKSNTSVIVVRRFLSGFCLGFFAGNDLALLIHHLSSFKISQGGTIFFTAFVGSTVLERIILVINAFNVKSIWNKKDDYS